MPFITNYCSITSLHPISKGCPNAWMPGAIQAPPRTGWFISWKIPSIKWMMTGGTPISGNPPLYIHHCKAILYMCVYDNRMMIFFVRPQKNIATIKLENSTSILWDIQPQSTVTPGFRMTTAPLRHRGTPSFINSLSFST